MRSHFQSYSSINRSSTMKAAQLDMARCLSGASASVGSLVHVPVGRVYRAPWQQTRQMKFSLQRSQVQRLLPQIACQGAFGGSHGGQGEYFQPLSQASMLQSQLASGWDVVGLGQAMVDFSASVSDEFLDRLSQEKGSRRIITVEERAEIIEALDASAYQVSAGGSLSNTLAALSRLGGAAQQQSGVGNLRVAMAGIVGADPLSQFYSAQLASAGVSILTEAEPHSCTGTVMVLTTPDANRTMLSYLGTQHEVVINSALEAAISSARMLLIEGYVWEMPNAVASITRAIEIAQRAGTLVVLTAGDAGCVERNREELWGALRQGADVLFANKSEAAALLGWEDCTAEEAALGLGPHCDMAVVTDGASGSCVSALGSLHVVPPFWASTAPVDTCGAGDAYAAGVLYGYLSGFDVAHMGRAGARCASAVIAQHGAGLSPDAALKLAAAMPPAVVASQAAVPDCVNLANEQ